MLFSLKWQAYFLHFQENKMSARLPSWITSLSMVQVKTVFFEKSGQYNSKGSYPTPDQTFLYSWNILLLSISLHRIWKTCIQEPRFNKVNFYWFIKDILKWNWLFFPMLVYSSEDCINYYQYYLVLLPCIHDWGTSILPTIAFASSVRISTQGKGKYILLRKNLIFPKLIV